MPLLSQIMHFLFQVKCSTVEVYGLFVDMFLVAFSLCHLPDWPSVCGREGGSKGKQFLKINTSLANPLEAKISHVAV